MDEDDLFGAFEASTNEASTAAASTVPLDKMSSVRFLSRISCFCFKFVEVARQVLRKTTRIVLA